MGGERFETSQPEAYLFGENQDLNFLGNKPVPVYKTNAEILSLECNGLLLDSSHTLHLKLMNQQRL
jgi:hypothetical protein